MIKAPILPKEKERLEAVRSMGILDTEKEERFDKITEEAAIKLGVPISAISVIDENREWYKSCFGLDQRQGERAISFCGHAIDSEEIFIVEDTLKDERFKDNPYVVGPPYIRFYAGVRLFDRKTRQPVAVLCVKDKKPRSLNVQELSTILELAERAETELNKTV